MEEDPTLKFSPNITVFIAPIYSKYVYSFYDEENRVYADTVRAWSKYTDNIMSWLYETNFHHYMFPYNTYSAMMDNYYFFKQQGANIMYNQGQRFNVIFAFKSEIMRVGRFQKACVAYFHRIRFAVYRVDNRAVDDDENFPMIVKMIIRERDVQIVERHFVLGMRRVQDVFANPVGFFYKRSFDRLTFFHKKSVAKNGGFVKQRNKQSGGFKKYSAKAAKTNKDIA